MRVHEVPKFNKWNVYIDRYHKYKITKKGKQDSLHNFINVYVLAPFDIWNCVGATD
jgi:hypothetical protein